MNKKFDFVNVLGIAFIFAVVVTVINMFSGAQFLGLDNVFFRFAIAFFGSIAGFGLSAWFIGYSNRLFSWFNLLSLGIMLIISFVAYYFTNNLTYMFGFWFIQRSLVFVGVVIIYFLASYWFGSDRVEL